MAHSETTQGDISSPTPGENCDMATLIQNSINRAKGFYEAKTKSNRSRYFLYTRISWSLIGIGTSMLGLHTYGFLNPALNSFPNLADSAFGFLITSPTAFPTMITAVGGIGLQIIKKRGFMNAWIRSSMTLTDITLLESALVVKLSSCSHDKSELIMRYNEELAQLVRHERGLWSKQTRSDLVTCI